MRIRPFVFVLFGLGATISVAQERGGTRSADAGSATLASTSRVRAELVRGRIDPERSKAGDMVQVKLRDDVRSNGDVLLRKGSTLEARIKNAGRTEGKEGYSFVEMDWLAGSAADGRV